MQTGNSCDIQGFMEWLQIKLEDGIGKKIKKSILPKDYLFTAMKSLNEASIRMLPSDDNWHLHKARAK